MREERNPKGGEIFRGCKETFVFPYLKSYSLKDLFIEIFNVENYSAGNDHVFERLLILLKDTF